jgi:PIN like domain
MRSRPSSGRPHAPAPPEFLLDRSLSQRSLPAALREAGLTARTLADVYGEHKAAETDDATWLALAGQRGWVVLGKDDHIRRRPAELRALAAGRVRMFCLTTAQLTFAAQADWILANQHRIIQATVNPGPYVYAVHGDRIAKLWPT